MLKGSRIFTTVCHATKISPQRSTQNYLPRIISRNTRRLSSDTRNPNFSNKVKWFYIPSGVGFGVIAFIQLRHIWRREQRHSEVTVDEFDKPFLFIFKQWQVDLIRKLPSRALSRGWGFLADCHLPIWLRKPLISSYAYMFGCDLTEIVHDDVAKFESFNKFFARKLKTGARVLDDKASVVSPADSQVLSFGTIQKPHLEIEQVKGLNYPLATFVGSGHPFYRSIQNAVSLDTFLPGSCSKQGDDFKICFCTLYLAPGDYHWFHSPTEWTVEYRRHIPGDLFSVHPRVLKSINGVFNFNERVILSGHWEHGPFMYAAVGAYNVGSIKLDIPMDRELRTNKPGDVSAYKDRLYGTGVMMKRGDAVGNFFLGSTVVLVFSAPKNFEFVVERGQKVKYGEALGFLINDGDKKSSKA